MKPRLILLALAALALTACRPSASRSNATQTDTTSIAISLPKDTVLKTETIAPQADTARALSTKELEQLMDLISHRIQTSDNDTLAQNVTGYGLYADGIHVHLRRATPRLTEQFRRIVTTSPAVKLEGPDILPPCPLIVPTDTLGVSLRALTTAVPLSARKMEVELVNRSDTAVLTGERYFLTYKDARGVWRKYAGAAFFNDLGYRLRPQSAQRFTASLYPLVNEHRPTRFRYFQRVDIGPARDVLLMCEFHLADVPEADTLPSTVIPSGSASASRSPEEPVYDLVDEMPEFPGGQDSLMRLCSRNLPIGSQIHGRVIVQFVVETDGSLSNFKVLRSSHTDFEEEALRIIRNLPRWKPGRKDGRTVRVRYIVPVVFRMQ